MKEIDTARMRYVLFLAGLLEQRGVAIGPCLSRAHIPKELLSQPDAVITVNSLMAFLDAAIKDTGWRLIGYEAGATPLAEHGPVGPWVLSAPTLYQALQRMVVATRRETSLTGTHVEFEAGMAWFCMTPLVHDPSRREQVELYNLRLMLQLVRAALGEEWWPERVRLSAVDEELVAGHPELSRLNIEFGARVTAVAVPMMALTRPMQGSAGRGTAWQAEEILADGMVTLDTMNTLQRLIETYLPYRPTLETMARITGISRRSLQRFLQSRGTSFTRLVEQVALARAIDLLKDTDIALAEIAQASGYSEAAHFSRAFRRMTGLTPSHYRRLMRDT